MYTLEDNRKIRRAINQAILEFCWGTELQQNLSVYIKNKILVATYDAVRYETMPPRDQIKSVVSLSYSKYSM